MLRNRPLAALASPIVLVACASGSVAEPAHPRPLSPIALHVDVTDAPRKLLHAHLELPVRPGPLTLYYPKWIPGEHGPTGPVTNLAGLRMKAAGKPVAWRRDAADMFALECDVPKGASTLEVDLDFLASSATEGFSSAASTTAELADVSWNQLLLYPKGARPDELVYAARLKLPAGWSFGTALPVRARTGDVVEFQPVPLTTLIDSPVVSGAHFRAIPLDAGPGPRHVLELVADSDAALAAPPELVTAFGALVGETGALFGARHYGSYHFLYTLSDHVASFGLEHHESSDNRAPERTLVDETRRKWWASLLPHEMVHSWNGKYRRPAGLATPDYQTPMRGDLLWVYEGLTEYLGLVLSARAGLYGEADLREDLAGTAAFLDTEAGRTWRPLSDTAVAAQLLYEAPSEWGRWRRSVDFYDEGALIWLEADVIVRKASNGRRSLDDFCRRFFGGESGPPKVVPYSLDDVVAALERVAHYDWKAFFASRLESTSAHAPLGGITGSGWRLVYDATPSEAEKASDRLRRRIDLTHSLGVSLRDDGTVGDVLRGSPADQAGLGPGMRVVAVDGRRFSADVVGDALVAGKTRKEPLELLVENGELFRTLRVDWHGGPRHPHLERDASVPDLLGAILKPLVERAAAPPATGPSAKGG
jgi:predicted metalloprotease with PDZ domain